MIGELRPYPAMRDAGVPWLGEVPDHWEVRRLKRLCARSALYGANVVASAYAATGVRFLRTTDITEEGHLKGKGVFIPIELVRDYLLADGDVLVSRSGTIGRSFLYDSKTHGPCAYAGYLVRFVPTSDVLPKYVFLFTKTPAFATFLRVMAISSTIENVNGEKYANAALPLPPLPEQAGIVRFLDHADRRIRRYIRAKQKLIKLLEEQKQAIIHRAVTRGLDPNVRLKPSGVEWLGEVPEHWDFTRLKFVAPHIVDCLHATPVYSDAGDHPAIRTADVRPGELLLHSARRVDEEHYRQWTARMAPTAGDILYTREGERFGISALVPPGVRLCISQRMMVFRIQENQNAAYIMWQINCQHVRAQAAADLIGAAAPHVNVARIRNFEITLPPRAEQDAIIAVVQEAMGHPNAAIQIAREEISLLREYRTRLIADVVTGKLDVREAAARLPEEVAETEPLDETDVLIDTEDAPADDVDAAPEEARA